MDSLRAFREIPDVPDIFASLCKAEEELVQIDRAMRAPNDRSPVIGDGLKAEAGAFLVLSRNGEPTLVPQYFTEIEVIADNDGVVEPVEAGGKPKRKGSALSQRLLDELAMQRRDLLANDPALDLMIFTLADTDGHDWRSKKAVTITGPFASGSVTGFEAKDARMRQRALPSQNLLVISTKVGMQVILMSSASKLSALSARRRAVSGSAMSSPGR